MEIKFETVRVGKFRKDIMQERILKENYNFLKNSLKECVNNINSSNEIIDVDIVIPAKGSRISITLNSIKDKEVKQLLIENFPDSIFKGDYSILEENINNRPYFPLNV
ncbi:MAG: hypothetical protein KF704_12330 [Crocinitomicaceae bacterium]|nr:hypothetical protein [Crocinitomicaceae bacterium]